MPDANPVYLWMATACIPLFFLGYLLVAFVLWRKTRKR